jgi:hypothetical protein
MSLAPSFNPSGRPRWLDGGAAGLGESLMAGVVIAAMNALLPLRLSLPELIFCWLAWPIGLAVGRGLTARVGPGWIRWLAATLVSAGFLLLLSRHAVPALTPPRALFAAGAMGVLVFAWRAWLRWVRPPDRTTVGEALRLISVLGVSAWAIVPFFTADPVGGVDARWYSRMLTDFIAQWRAGVFPVFTGQGEFAYNGGIHPFRTAPFFQYCAGIWDTLTWHALTPLALQHLAVVTCALAGGLGMYAALTALAPARRWAAVAVAVIYVTSPAFLGAIYSAELYMTFMAVGVLPAFVYGQVRVTQERGEDGWPWLAAGLALVWVCHAGVAVFCTLATLLIQGGRFLLTEQPAKEWRRAVAAGILFLLLGFYYFVSMAELKGVTQEPSLPVALQLTGVALALAGLVRGVFWRQRVAWMWLAVGLVLLLRTQPAWLWVVAGAALFGGIVAVLARRWHWFDPREQAWALLTGGLIAAAGLIQWRWGGNFPTANQGSLEQLRRYADSVPGFISPIMDRAHPYQPGFGVLVLLLAVTWSALADGALRARLFVIPLWLLVLSCRPVPGLSEFWVAHFPLAFVEVTNFPLDYRLFPALVGLTCGAGFMWVADWADRRPTAYRVVCGFFLLLALQGACQAWTYVKSGWSITDHQAQAEGQSRSESAVLSRYAYDHRRIPDYFSNGNTDARLESRLFDETWHRLLVGPDATARQMETAGSDQQLIAAVPDPLAPTWLALSPHLTLAPGEHLLLRFEFRARPYAGYLFVRSENMYREYYLPDSGWPRAFGTGPEESKVISLWNSGPTIEHVTLTFNRSEVPTKATDLSDFGQLTVSHFRPELAAIRTLSLIPYRVALTASENGWLETPRVFLPGYVATMDGRPIPVTASPQSLVSVPVTKGIHVVEVRFRGTFSLWTAWWVSALAWAGLLVAGLRRGLARA